MARYGDATVYSLSPTKQMTCGEGGLIVTRHKGLAALLRRARNYGKGDYEASYPTQTPPQGTTSRRLLYEAYGVAACLAGIEA